MLLDSSNISTSVGRKRKKHAGVREITNDGDHVFPSGFPSRGNQTTTSGISTKGLSTKPSTISSSKISLYIWGLKGKTRFWGIIVYEKTLLLNRSNVRATNFCTKVSSLNQFYQSISFVVIVQRISIVFSVGS